MDHPYNRALEQQQFVALIRQRSMVQLRQMQRVLPYRHSSTRLQAFASQLASFGCLGFFFRVHDGAQVKLAH